MAEVFLYFCLVLLVSVYDLIEGSSCGCLSTGLCASLYFVVCRERKQERVLVGGILQLNVVLKRPTCKGSAVKNNVSLPMGVAVKRQAPAEHASQWIGSRCAPGTPAELD